VVCGSDEGLPLRIRHHAQKLKALIQRRRNTSSKHLRSLVQWRTSRTVLLNYVLELDHLAAWHECHGISSFERPDLPEQHERYAGDTVAELEALQNDTRVDGAPRFADAIVENLGSNVVPVRIGSRYTDIRLIDMLIAYLDAELAQPRPSGMIQIVQGFEIIETQESAFAGLLPATANEDECDLMGLQALHKVWRLRSTEIIDNLDAEYQMQSLLASSVLFDEPGIADGQDPARGILETIR
jgi:hypothetical protein